VRGLKIMKPRIPASRKSGGSRVASGQRHQPQENNSINDSASTAASGKDSFMATAAELRKPIPMISHDGPIVFEAFIFIYCMMALLLQYLHLYKSVWWLPHSYNSYAMNFYLIDKQLILFCGLVLVRRLVWTLIKRLILAVTPSAWAKSFVIVARSLNTFAILLGLLYLAASIVQNHPLINMLYLTYPVTLYALLFGLSGEEFLELTPSTSNNAAYSCGASKSIKIVSDAKTGFYHTTGPSSFPTINTAPWLEQKADVMGRATPQGQPGLNQIPATSQHPNTHPGLIRHEVAVLKADFNARLYQILFNTIVSAYYGAVIPCLFAQSTLYYDLAWVGRHALLVGVGAFVLYVVQCFPSSYVLMMNRTATLLGQWVKLESNRSALVVNNLCATWSSGMVCPINTTVKYQNKLYKSEGQTNCAEPGNPTHSRFYTLFKEPSLILSVLLIVQSGLVMAQHISLTWSSHWYQLLSEALMLFSNYYALFKVLRDYIVFWRFFCNEPDPEQDK